MWPCRSAGDEGAAGSAGGPEEKSAGPRARRPARRVVRRLLLAVAAPLLAVLAAGLTLPFPGHCADGTLPANPATSARSAGSGPRPPLRVLFDEDLPPYAYRLSGEAHRARGIYPELTAEAFHRLGLGTTLEPTPWARAMAELDAGRAGVCGLYSTGQRLLLHDFSSPLFEERLHLVVPAGTDMPGAPAGPDGEPLAALRGMRLGVVRGWSYGDTLDAAREAGAFVAEEAGSEAQNMLKVAGGRLDGAIITREGALWLRERLGLTRLVAVAPLPLAVLPVHLAFRRQAGQRELLRAFDAAIRDMRADGTYARIVERALDGQ